jgi:hypothetical protein
MDNNEKEYKYALPFLEGEILFPYSSKIFVLHPLMNQIEGIPHFCISSPFRFWRENEF